MAIIKFWRRNNLPEPETIQIQSMRTHFPGFAKSRNREGNLEFIGNLQVKTDMPVFTVRVEFRGDNAPRVYVLNPVIQPNSPHVYWQQGGFLCLYKPSDFKWTASKPLSNYILPWTACWLYFYEVWRDRGIWYGPEAKHDNELK